MLQRKSKKILFYFFLIIVISSVNNLSLHNLKFNNINDIKIYGLSKKENNILLQEIKKMNLENIFFINSNEINNLMNSNTLIEHYEIKKRYPSTIYVKIQKTNFYAKINIDDKTFLIGSNGKLSPNHFQNNDLPFIFGKPNIKEFLYFKNIIDQSKFSYDQIENLYFYPSKRWDLKLKNNILLKLSEKPTIEYLDDLYQFLEKDNVEKFTIVDARLKNQIILNE